MERRLAAVLAADVVGYSRLMGEDESGTLTALKAIRTDLIDPKVAAHNGRTVKLMGDGALVEFPSVVDAVECAAGIQRAMALENETKTGERRIDFRIGINLGDVIIEGDDIYGDGVNIAARLEGLADPGGICVSRSVYTQIKGKVDLAFEDLGEQRIKNIADPVRVFKLLLDAPAAEQIAAITTSTKRSLRRLVIAVGFAFITILTGLLLWQRPWAPREEPASEAKMAFPLPDKPSIAVLPFNNMSEDQSQEYFVDGMTEDLITDLSQISGLFVIARNSSFSYKGHHVKVHQVAEELGVRYVLEGSVRRAGNEVRINAQLIDATTGGHLWAERYDGTMNDVFDLQDQVTGQIVAALAVSLTGEERVQQARHDTENVEAHDAYLQGWALYKLLTPEDLAKAIPFFEQAIRLDPNYAQAHAALASLYWDVYQNDWAFDLGMPSSRAESRANKHLEEALEAPIPLAHTLQSRMFSAWGFPIEAVAEAEKAVELDANDATALSGLAHALVQAGRPKDGLAYIEEAMRLDPHHPPSYLITLGSAQFGMERFEDAAATFERAVRRNPDNEIPFIYLASAYGHLGRIDDADKVIDEINFLRDLQGLNELSLRDTTAYSMDPQDFQINFKRFGSQPVQDRVRAGLSDIPALKWQFLVTVHLVLEAGKTWFEVEGAKLIDIPTAKSIHDRGVVFIDVSNKSVWNASHIPRAIHLSWSRTEDPRFSETTLRDVAKHNDEIVLYSSDELLSPAWEAAKAVTWGYQKVHFFNGGVQAWKEAGYAIETAQ